MLKLNYNFEALSRDLVERLERAGRRAGLDLESLELLGQDATVASDFVRAEDSELAPEFLARVDFEALRLARKTRERYADRLRITPSRTVALG